VPSAPRRIHLSGLGRAGVGLGIGLAVGLLLLLLRQTDVVEGIEARLVDARTRAFAGDRSPDPRIVVCQVEEGDVLAVRRDLKIPWPWPLDLDAKIVDTMRAAGASVLVADVMFLDHGAGADDLPASGPVTPMDEAAWAGEADAGEALGKAFRDWGRVVLAIELTRLPRWELPGRVSVAQQRLGVRFAGPSSLPSVFRRPGDDLPARRVLDGAARVGFVNVPVDVDNVVRRAWTFAGWGDHLATSLPLAAASLATGKDAEPGYMEDAVRVGDARQRTAEDGSFFVNFRSTESRPYARVSASQVLAWHEPIEAGKSVSEEARAALDGKIVVFGVNLSGAKDVVSCPVGEAFEGPQLQATAIDNLLHGDGRAPASRGYDALVLLVVTGTVGLLGCVPRRRWLSHVAAAGALATLVVAAMVKFSHGVVIDLATPALGVVLTWAGSLVERTLTEGRYNRWLEGTFSRYMPNSVIEALKADPSRLELGGRRRDVTLLFSDVAGFTKTFEHLDPHEGVAFLNRYFTAHCDALLSEGGVIDKFIGDGVMAFFGDPLEQPDHAARACRAALAVQASLAALEPHWRRLGMTSFVVRIGLNSGEAIVGNMGSDQRLDYTCMGDTVNLASRLEGANKAFGTRILAGPGTWRAAGDSVLVKPIADVVVVGREAPVAVAEVLATREGTTPEISAHAAAFARARGALAQGDVPACERALDEAERAKPGDGPCAWLRGVVARTKAGEEPSPWSGVVRLDAK
jgi:adenylate cyclase